MGARCSRSSASCRSPRSASGSRSRSARSSTLSSPRTRLRQLALHPHRRQADPGKTQNVLVHEVARLPAREELGVEAVQPLDLEEAASAISSAAPDDALEPPARRVDEAREGREVERRLLDAAVAEQLERRGRRGTPSGRSGVSRWRRISESETAAPSVARGEVQEAADAGRSRRGPRTTRLSPWSSRRSSSSDIAKPRSASPPRQLRLTASSSASSASESSPSRRSSAV